MIPDSENPATLGATGLPNVVQLAGFERTEVSPEGLKSQVPGPWEEARAYERASASLARAALAQRGADRLLSLSLASSYALAARDLALCAGGAR